MIADLANWRLLRFVTLLSVRQAARRARRSLASFIGVMGGLLLAFTQLGVQDALYESAVRLHHALSGEVVVIPNEFDMLLNPVWFEKNALSLAAGHPSVERITYLYELTPMIRGLNGDRAQPLLVIGVDPLDPAIVPDRIEADLSKLQIPGQALWDRLSRPHWGDVNGALKKNGFVELYTAMASLTFQEPLRVVDNFKMGSSITLLGSMIISLDTFRDIGGQSAERPNMAVIKLKARSDPESVAKSLNELLPQHVHAVSVSNLIQKEKRFWSKETPIGYLLDMSAAIGIFICAVFVGQALVQTVDENLSEYAVLRTLDVPDSAFVLAIVMTGVFLVLAATPAAALVAVVFYAVISAATGLPLEMSETRAFQIFVMSTVTAVIAGLLTGRRLLTADPARLL